MNLSRGSTSFRRPLPGSLLSRRNCSQSWPRSVKIGKTRSGSESVPRKSIESGELGGLPTRLAGSVKDFGLVLTRGDLGFHQTSCRPTRPPAPPVFGSCEVGNLAPFSDVIDEPVFPCAGGAPPPLSLASMPSVPPL